MTAALEITALADEDGLSLAGELDIHTAPQLRAALAEVAAMRNLRLDLSQLTFIDSAGLHTVMTPSRETAVALSCSTIPQNAILRTLEIVGLHKHQMGLLGPDGPIHSQLDAQNVEIRHGLGRLARD